MHRPPLPNDVARNNHYGRHSTFSKPVDGYPVSYINSLNQAPETLNRMHSQHSLGQSDSRGSLQHTLNHNDSRSSLHQYPAQHQGSRQNSQAGTPLSHAHPPPQVHRQVSMGNVQLQQDPMRRYSLPVSRAGVPRQPMGAPSQQHRYY